MHTSSLKHAIAERTPLLGTFIKTPHPHVVEVLGTSGLDCLCIDAEHAPFDRRDIDASILAARSVGIPVVVRTPSSDAHEILNALDCGADGVVVPHVRTFEEAERIARSVHYGPRGRGYAGSSRAAGYGATTIAQHMQGSLEKSVLIAQIEDLEALDEIDQIAKVPGIDALFVGRIDLTVALGVTSPDDPKVVEAVKAIVTASVANGKPVGMFTPNPEDVPMWRELGVTIFLLGSDHTFLRSGARSLKIAAKFG